MAKSTTREIERSDRIAVIGILAVGSFAGGFIAATGLIRAMFRVLDPSSQSVSLLADLTVVDKGGVNAVADRIQVTTDQLPSATIWLLATSDAIAALAIAAVTVSAATVLWRIAGRRPFHRSMRLAAMVAGCSIALGSILAQGLGGLATMMAANDLNDVLDGVAQVGFEFQPVGVIVGFAVIALSYIFDAGERLQRDTEGLV